MFTSLVYARALLCVHYHTRHTISDFFTLGAGDQTQLLMLAQKDFTNRAISPATAIVYWIHFQGAVGCPAKADGVSALRFSILAGKGNPNSPDTGLPGSTYPGALSVCGDSKDYFTRPQPLGDTSLVFCLRHLPFLISSLHTGSTAGSQQQLCTGMALPKVLLGTPNSNLPTDHTNSSHSTPPLSQPQNLLSFLLQLSLSPGNFQMQSSHRVLD